MPVPDLPKHAPLSSRSRQTQRTIEGYLMTGGPPRWMERFMQVENGIARERRRLAEAYADLRDRFPADFADRWRAFAARQDLEKLNLLIRQHNTFYPMERDLPMDPRTGDYIPVHGRTFKRPELTPEWILSEFPPDPAA